MLTLWLHQCSLTTLHQSSGIPVCGTELQVSGSQPGGASGWLFQVQLLSNVTYWCILTPSAPHRGCFCNAAMSLCCCLLTGDLISAVAPHTHTHTHAHTSTSHYLTLPTTTGILNVQLTSVRQSYSTVAVPALNIPQGMFFRAVVGVLGMSTDVSFLLSPDGLELSVAFDAREFSRVSAQLAS